MSQKLVVTLTDVVSDDGERFQVGLPHVLDQGAGIFLEMTHQGGTAPVRALNLLPVSLMLRVQYSTARSNNVLELKT